MKDSKLIQNTDIYPVLYKELEKLIKKEHFIIQISNLDYIHHELFQFNDNLENGKAFLNLLDQSFYQALSSLKKNSRFREYFKRTKESKIKFLLNFLKLYRLFKYVKNYGLNLVEILQQIQKERNDFGVKINMPLKDILSDQEFETYDKDILSCFDKGLLHSLIHFRQTGYYKIQRNKRKKSFLKTIKHIKKYFNLFISIRKKSYQINVENIKHFPWVFVSDQTIIRIDGHHRCGVLKFLNYEKVPALLVRPSNILQYELSSDKLKESLKGHHDVDKEFELYK